LGASKTLNAFLAKRWSIGGLKSLIRWTNLRGRADYIYTRLATDDQYKQELLL